MGDFRSELQTLINRFSMEGGSHTPDFVLADYVQDCLAAFDRATRSRDEWYIYDEQDEAREPTPGA